LTRSIQYKGRRYNNEHVSKLDDFGGFAYDFAGSRNAQ
jgi:hypothetical protein